MTEPTPTFDRPTSATARFGLDFPSGAAQPRAGRFVVATVVAVALSIAACAGLVAIGVRVFPSTAGYEHFQFGDYTKLTVIGVVIASLGWPATCYVTTRARRLYLVLAVLVSIVGGRLWDMTGQAAFAFLPIAIAILPLVLCPLWTDFKQRHS